MQGRRDAPHYVKADEHRQNEYGKQEYERFPLPGGQRSSQRGGILGDDFGTHVVYSPLLKAG